MNIEELNNVDNTTITDSDKTVEKTTETQSAEPFRSFSTEDEFNKLMQSERSKAKNEMLKEFGVASVSDFRNLKKTYEDAIGKTQTLENTVEDLNHKMILKDLNVKSENIDDFMSLAKKRVSENKTFEDAAKEVASLYNTFINTPVITDTKLGTEKTEPKKESTLSPALKERYSWLKEH